MKRSVLLLFFLAPLKGVSAVSLLPFTENFDSGTSSWLNGSNQALGYASTGGVGDSGYVFTNGTIDTGGLGSIVFRGSNSAGASGGAFVGNWLTAGVTSFRTYVWHNAPVSLNFYIRFDKGFGSAADSNNLLVSPNTWTLLDIPIVDSVGTSGQVFQSYEAAGPSGFATIFGDIKNIQIALGSVQDAVTNGQSYTVGLDGVSIVPEPATGVLLVLAGMVLSGLRRFQD